MSLNDYIRFRRRDVIPVLAGVLIGTGLAGLVCVLQSPTYQSTAEVYVSVQSATNVQDLNQGSTFTQQVVKSFADVATRPIVLNRVIRDLHLPLTASELAGDVSANAPLNTVVVELSATSSSSTQAAAIANSMSSNLQSVVPTLAPGVGGTESAVKVTSVQSAVPSSAPISPNVSLNLVLGMFLGGVAGLVAAVARRRLSTKVFTFDDLAEISDLPLLAEFVYNADAARSPLTMVEDPRGIRAEGFRSLRTAMTFSVVGKRRKAVVVTSTVPGEGKSSTVANLALALASAGENVIIVDADLRRPAIESYFGLIGAIGLTDVLVGQASLADATQSWGDGSLTILASGQIPPNPSELLQSREMAHLLKDLRRSYDYVLIDAPPLLPVTDAVVLSKRARQVLVVVGSGKVTRPQVKVALDSLLTSDAHILGVVMTMVRVNRAGAYAYEKYGYGDQLSDIRTETVRTPNRTGPSASSTPA